MELKVRFYELDPYGHLNHSAFIQFFETGRVELLDEVGLDLGGLRGPGIPLRRDPDRDLVPQTSARR